MLQNESIKRWLGGLERAWTLRRYEASIHLFSPQLPQFYNAVTLCEINHGIATRHGQSDHPATGPCQTTAQPGSMVSKGWLSWWQR